MLLRRTLEECNNYTCALGMLQNEVMCAPGYFILAGTKDFEGVVISRDQTGLANGGLQFLNETTWYLVQTNEDHFRGQCYDRCQAANNNFKALGQAGATVSTVFDKVLNVAPNINRDSVFTTVMVPSKGLFLAELV